MCTHFTKRDKFFKYAYFLVSISVLSCFFILFHCLCCFRFLLFLLHIIWHMNAIFGGKLDAHKQATAYLWCWLLNYKIKIFAGSFLLLYWIDYAGWINNKSKQTWMLRLECRFLDTLFYLEAARNGKRRKNPRNRFLPVFSSFIRFPRWSASSILLMKHSQFHRF